MTKYIIEINEDGIVNAPHTLLHGYNVGSMDSNGKVNGLELYEPYDNKSRSLIEKAIDSGMTAQDIINMRREGLL